MNMDNFNLDKLREYIPKEMPKMPSWPTTHRSMNPDDDDDLESRPPIPPKDTGKSRDKGKGKAGGATTSTLFDPLPIKEGPKTNLDLVNECDNFPYYHDQPDLFFAHIHTYYGFYIADHPEMELGYVLPSVAEMFRGLPDWKVDDDNRSLTMITGHTEEERSRTIAMTCSAMRGTEHFKILRGWRDELYPVYGPKTELLFSIERSASALFGVVTYGVHMMAYTMSKSEDGARDKTKDMKLWIPRRAATKQTYGGMLDNTVAGGIATGELPLESVIREAGEEASLEEDLVRKNIHAAGAVTYFHIRDQRAGGETRLLQPEVQYVYDLELDESVVPKPSDNEVEGFELKTIEETKEALKNGEFKPNCAMVLLDFFVRHGILTAQDENFIEMNARLHRRLEFPTI